MRPSPSAPAATPADVTVHRARMAVRPAELDALLARVLKLAATPHDDSDDFLLDVLDTRAHGAELALRADFDDSSIAASSGPVRENITLAA